MFDARPKKGAGVEIVLADGTTAARSN